MAQQKDHTTKARRKPFHFADRLAAAVRRTDSALVVGLDPQARRLPTAVLDPALRRYGHTARAVAAAIWEFNRQILAAVADIVPAVKVQLAYYEAWGVAGMAALQRTILQARRLGLLVIADGKRGDIGETAEAYAQAYLRVGDVEVAGSHIRLQAFAADALTVQPYLGSDSMAPLIAEAARSGRGLFVLVRTSNPGAREFQDLRGMPDARGERGSERNAPPDPRAPADGEYAATPFSLPLSLCERVGLAVERWGAGNLGACGYSHVGAVVGATYPEEAARLRALLPHTWFLMPGLGAQGAAPSQVAAGFAPDGLGAVVNSSRGVIFAYEKDEKAGPDGAGFAASARRAALEATAAIRQALGRIP